MIKMGTVKTVEPANCRNHAAASREALEGAPAEPASAPPGAPKAVSCTSAE